MTPGIMSRACAGVLAALLACVTTSVAAQSAPAVGDGRTSPFYTWTGPAPTKPGAMLRTEPLPGELGLPSAARQMRILYSSTDGVAGSGVTIVSGAIFLPKGTAPAGGWPIIAWAHGTVGIADICAPSWAGRAYRDVAFLDKWLKQGFAIVATDYQGLGTPGVHPYVETRPEAYSVLDSVRAALGAGLPLANKVVVVGQSQGGGAALSTAGYAPDYAPDVHLLAAVSTGAPYLTLPMMAAAAKVQDPDAVDPTIGYLFYLAFTLPPGTPSDVTQMFSPAVVPLARVEASQCIFTVETDAKLARLTRRTALNPAGMAKATAAVVPRLTYPTLAVHMPVFVGTGEQDIDVPPVTQHALARDMCAAGTKVEFHGYAGEDHSGGLTRSFDDSLPFVRRVLSGQPVPGNCASLGAAR